MTRESQAALENVRIVSTIKPKLMSAVVKAHAVLCSAKPLMDQLDADVKHAETLKEPWRGQHLGSVNHVACQHQDLLQLFSGVESFVQALVCV
jgi:hypothetical protein